MHNRVTGRAGNGVDWKLTVRFPVPSIVEVPLRIVDGRWDVSGIVRNVSYEGSNSVVIICCSKISVSAICRDPRGKGDKIVLRARYIGVASHIRRDILRGRARLWGGDIGYVEKTLQVINVVCIVGGKGSQILIQEEIVGYICLG